MALTRRSEGSQATEASPSAHNARTWRRGKYLYAYDNRVLLPAEVQILVRYRDQLSGRVLDLGCGAGRILFYLVMLGVDAYGLDISPAMVEHCRRTIPGAKVIQGDLAALRELVDGSFNVVIASDNVLDVFNDAERREVLRQIRELLEPDGLLIFSSHDLSHIEDPPEGSTDYQRVTLQKFWTCSPQEIARSVQGRLMSVRNRRRLGPLQEQHEDYAIVNDFSHFYSLLHYYIRRDDQEKQLNELGFRLIECLDSDGRLVPPGSRGPVDYLHYIAQAV